jgi:hypothetical protein
MEAFDRLHRHRSHSNGLVDQHVRLCRPHPATRPLSVTKKQRRRVRSTCSATAETTMLRSTVMQSREMTSPTRKRREHPSSPCNGNSCFINARVSCLRRCTERSCFSAWARLTKVPRFRRRPAWVRAFREYGGTDLTSASKSCEPPSRDHEDQRDDGHVSGRVVPCYAVPVIFTLYGLSQIADVLAGGVRSKSCSSAW